MAPPPRPAPARELRWDVPESLGFWARAEIPAVTPGQNSLRGAASSGFRFNWSLCEPGSDLDCDRIRLSTRPQLRSVSDAPTADGGTGPAVGLTLLQDAEFQLRPGVLLRAGAEFGNQIGAEPLAAGSAGAVAKVRAGATLDLRTLGTGVPLRVGVSLAVAQGLGPSTEEKRPDDCQGAIEIRYADYVPFRVTAPCDAGRRDSWIGFGLRGQF
jgi:hypothetical protein